MSERERNRELVADAFGAFQRGDVEAVNPEIEVACGVLGFGFANRQSPHPASLPGGAWTSPFQAHRSWTPH